MNGSGRRMEEKEDKGGEMKDGERREEDEASKRAYGMKRWSEKER